MKKLILILLVMPLVQGCNQEPAGRYQIVAGTYDQNVNTDSVTSQEHGIGRNGWTAEEHGVFKIDTQTGRTWIYEDVNNLTVDRRDPGHNGWKELKDLPPK